MIVRVFRVEVFPEKRAAFETFFRDTAIPLVEAQPGIVSVTAGVPRKDGPDAFCMVMVWEDLEALKAFVGEDWNHAHIHPDEADMVKARTLYHYDLAA